MNQFSAVAGLDPLRLHPPLTERHKWTQSYRPAKGLTEAADVAMMLGIPLLLSGPPGTGKTRAAFWLADALGVGEPLRFDVKSGSTGTDLLYHFDEVARFRDSTRQVSRPLTHYLRFNALGEAIIRAAGGAALLETIAGGDVIEKGDRSSRRLEGPAMLERHAELLAEALGAGWQPIDGAVRTAHLLPEDRAFAAAPPRQLVVLIDEIDKAPRDTPNDLLMELEDMRFTIPELGLTVRADPEVRPVVAITSNAEKSLPEPFLRRCAFFDIPLPDEAELREIIGAVLGNATGGAPLVSDVIEIFEQLRAPENEVGRVPGTAELLAWLDVLHRQPGLDLQSSLAERVGEGDEPIYGLGCLLKTGDDLATGARIVREWAAAAAGHDRRRRRAGSRRPAARAHRPARAGRRAERRQPVHVRRPGASRAHAPAARRPGHSVARPARRFLAGAGPVHLAKPAGAFFRAVRGAVRCRGRRPAAGRAGPSGDFRSARFALVAPALAVDRDGAGAWRRGGLAGLAAARPDRPASDLHLAIHDRAGQHRLPSVGPRKPVHDHPLAGDRRRGPCSSSPPSCCAGSGPGSGAAARVAISRRTIGNRAISPSRRPCPRCTDRRACAIASAGCAGIGRCRARESMSGAASGRRSRPGAGRSCVTARGRKRRTMFFWPIANRRATICPSSPRSCPAALPRRGWRRPLMILGDPRQTRQTFPVSDDAELDRAGGQPARLRAAADPAEPDHCLDASGRAAGWLGTLPEERPILLNPRREGNWDWREARLRGGGRAHLPRFARRDRRLCRNAARPPPTSFTSRAAAAAPRPRTCRCLLERHRAALLDETAPDPAETADFLADLELWLGAEAMTVLRAAAVFPLVEPALTVLLASRLEDQAGKALLTEERLLALARLPWLRAGRMPSWLRGALARGLTPDRLAVTLGTIQAFLNPVADGPRGRLKLDFSQADDPAARRRLLEWLRGNPDSAYNDPLLLDALDDRAPEELGQERDPAPTHLIGKAIQAIDAKRDGVTLVVTLVLACGLLAVLPDRATGRRRRRRRQEQQVTRKSPRKHHPHRLRRQ